MSRKFKIAITGGIGSGKTLVCNIFSEKGYPIIVADDIAKEVLISDNVVKERIIKEFGQESFQKNKINIKYLADKIFSHPDNVKKINSIVHPQTIRKINDLMIEKLESSPMVIVESALVYEARISSDYDFIILVTSEDKNRIKRVSIRDNVKNDLVINRIKNQLPDKIKKPKADFIIENNSTIEDLKTRAHFILTILEKLL